MTATFEIIKGKKVKVSGLQAIVRIMYNEGIESCILEDGRNIIVYDDGTYEIG